MASRSLPLAAAALLAATALFATASAQLPDISPDFSVQAPKVTVQAASPMDPVDARVGLLVPLDVTIEIPGPVVAGNLTGFVNVTAPEAWNVLVGPNATFAVPYETSHETQILTIPLQLYVDPADHAPALEARALLVQVSANSTSLGTGTGETEIKVAPAFSASLAGKAPAAPARLDGAGVSRVKVALEAAPNAPATLTVTAVQLPLGCSIVDPAAVTVPRSENGAPWRGEVPVETRCGADSNGGTVTLRATLTMAGGSAQPITHTFPLRIASAGATEYTSSAPAATTTPSGEPNSIPAAGLVALLGVAAGAAYARRRR